MRLLSVRWVGLIVAVFFVGCTGSGVRETNSGLKYVFYHKNETQPKVKKNDVVEAYLDYRVNDSVIFSGGAEKIPFLVDPVYEGDLMEGIQMMHVGDSASFFLNAGDFFEKMLLLNKQSLPFEGNQEVQFNIKITGVR